MSILATETLCNERQKMIRDLEWNLVQQVLPAGPGRFLDVGCGTGYQMAKAKAMGFDVTGIDPHPGTDGVHAELVTNVRASIQKGVATSLPFPEGHFDVVFSSHALVVMEDIPGALREMRRVLKPQGTLVLVLDTAVMAWIKILSFALFDTHNRVRQFFRTPSFSSFGRILFPPAYRTNLRSAWNEVFAWRIPHWRKLLSPLFDVQDARPTFLYTFPDYTSFIIRPNSNRLASAVIVIARPKLGAT